MCPLPRSEDRQAPSAGGGTAYDPIRTTWRKIIAFLDGPITKRTETTPREILNMLAVVLVFILAYAWLGEIQALVGHPFG
jgi:hypothetical protein